MDAGSVGSIITSVVLVAIIVIIVGLLISCVKIVPQAQALVVHKLLIHGAILLFFNGNVSNTGRIRRWYVYGTCTVRI